MGKTAMNILVTGARGFIGKNLVATLENIRDGKDRSRGFQAELTMLAYDRDMGAETLDAFCAQADFVVHLAGVNRPKDEKEFMEGNFGFTAVLLETLQKHGSRAPILVASSVQAGMDNPYGRSKKAGEDCIFAYGRSRGVPVYVYRLPNVFGKWCRPHYNSAVATFCYQIARDLPITVNAADPLLTLVYVDDVVAEILNAIKGDPNRAGDFCAVPVEHQVRLHDIVRLLRGFRDARRSLAVPDMADAFQRKLYATYLSYLPEDGFSYPLDMKTDARGSFTEVLRTARHGQVSVNISGPHIVKGNHWHHTKNEKFLVVSGRGVIRFRKIDSDTVNEYFVDGQRLTVVDIPTGYTHNIENLGDTDMVTLMWASEPFDPDNPDTYFLPV